jgi:glucose/arabinose dehydrogenase
MRRSLSAVVVAASAVVVTTTMSPPASAVPAGFSDTVVWSLTTPTGIAFAPDGRVLLTQDSGQVRVVRNGHLNTTPAVSVASQLCADGERGLGGIATDPAFSSNHFIYVYYTHNAHNSCAVNGPSAPENRVVRYVLGSDDIARSATVIVDHLPSPSEHHEAGDLHFGADGFLYISVGDGGCTLGDPTKCDAANTNSRRLDIPLGKILRVTRDGWVPSSNPFTTTAGARRCTSPSGVSPGTGVCKETYASGLRNPYRFSRRPGTSSFYVNDTGQDTWEEIDNLAPGKDYGWNIREGHCATGSTTDCGATSFANPIFDYGHDSCGAITGGTFVPTGAWVAPYSGSYLFADFNCGTIFRLVPSGTGFTRSAFITGIQSPTVMVFSGQSLYYLSYFGGKVHRVQHTG